MNAIKTLQDMERFESVLCFTIAYLSLVAWWSHFFQLPFLQINSVIDTTSIEEYFRLRRENMQAVTGGKAWWQYLLDILSPIVTAGGTLVITLLINDKWKSRKKNKKS